MLRPLRFAVGFVVLAAAGCGSGGPQLAVVTGRVTFDGQPLPGGLLRLKATNPASPVQETNVRLKPDGTFIVPDAPTGPVTVSIDTEVIRTDLQVAAMNPAAPPLAVKYVAIPKRYAAFATSDLGFEVSPGPQVRDFELKP